jgi:hypothetical protein
MKNSTTAAQSPPIGTQELRERHRTQEFPGARSFVSLLRSTRSRRFLARWLIYCADPLLGRTKPPHRLPSPRDVGKLIDEAEAHGVLPAAVKKLRPLATGADYAAVFQHADERLRLLRIHTMMLRHHGEALMRRLTGLPAMAVKGPAFASAIYPDPALRPFTDIDLLVAPEALPKIEAALQEEGFLLVPSEDASDRREWKWLHANNDSIMIEVHTNLVHAAGIQGAMSLDYATLAEAENNPAAAMLAIAIIHGALHQFERMRYVVDVCQAARALTTRDDERCFLQIVHRSGADLAAASGLRLAYQLFKEPRCKELLRAVGPVKYQGLAALLMRPAVVTSAMNDARVFHAWRRQGLRELLKRGRLPTEPDAIVSA